MGYRFWIGAAVVVASGGMAFALDNGGGAGGNCALISSEMEDGTETNNLECCNPGEIASVDLGQLKCSKTTGVQDIPGWVPTIPTTWPPIGGVPGPDTPPDDPKDCKEQPTLPPIGYSVALPGPSIDALDPNGDGFFPVSKKMLDLMHAGGYFHGYSLEERQFALAKLEAADTARWAAWEQVWKTKPKCNDKKKAECDACNAKGPKLQNTIDAEDAACRSKAKKNAQNRCNEGELPDGSLAPGYEEHAECVKNANEDGDPNTKASLCLSAIAKTECDWLGGCHLSSQWMSCINGYTAGSEDFEEEFGIDVGVEWTTPVGVGVSVDGKYGGKTKWAPTDGTLDRCRKMKEKKEDLAEQLVADCKKAVEKKYPGGEYTCAP